GYGQAQSSGGLCKGTVLRLSFIVLGYLDEPRIYGVDPDKLSESNNTKWKTVFPDQPIDHVITQTLGVFCESLSGYPSLGYHFSPFFLTNVNDSRLKKTNFNEDDLYLDYSSVFNNLTNFQFVVIFK